MKKILLLVLFFSFPAIAASQTEEARLQTKIEFYAQKYSVSVDTMNHIISKESSYKSTAIGDMQLTCKRTGKPVRARGLVQITECWWPEVTDEQAFDEDYSLEFLAKWLSKGYCRWWSTCPTRVAFKN